MSKAQLETAAEMTEEAADAVELMLTQGTSQAMNRFNRRIAPLAPGEDE